MSTRRTSNKSTETASNVPHNSLQRFIQKEPDVFSQPHLPQAPSLSNEQSTEPFQTTIQDKLDDVSVVPAQDAHSIPQRRAPKSKSAKQPTRGQKTKSTEQIPITVDPAIANQPVTVSHTLDDLPDIIFSQETSDVVELEVVNLSDSETELSTQNRPNDNESLSTQVDAEQVTATKPKPQRGSRRQPHQHPPSQDFEDGDMFSKSKSRPDAVNAVSLLMAPKKQPARSPLPSEPVTSCMTIEDPPQEAVVPPTQPKATSRKSKRPKATDSTSSPVPDVALDSIVQKEQPKMTSSSQSISQQDFDLFPAVASSKTPGPSLRFGFRPPTAAAVVPATTTAATSSSTQQHNSSADTSNVDEDIESNLFPSSAKSSTGALITAASWFRQQQLQHKKQQQQQPENATSTPLANPSLSIPRQLAPAVATGLANMSRPFDPWSMYPIVLHLLQNIDNVPSFAAIQSLIEASFFAQQIQFCQNSLFHRNQAFLPFDVTSFTDECRIKWFARFFKTPQNAATSHQQLINNPSQLDTQSQTNQSQLTPNNAVLNTCHINPPSTAPFSPSSLFPVVPRASTVQKHDPIPQLPFFSSVSQPISSAISHDVSLQYHDQPCASFQLPDTTYTTPLLGASLLSDICHVLSTSQLYPSTTSSQSSSKPPLSSKLQHLEAIWEDVNPIFSQIVPHLASLHSLTCSSPYDISNLDKQDATESPHHSNNISAHMLLSQSHLHPLGFFQQFYLDSIYQALPNASSTIHFVQEYVTACHHRHNIGKATLPSTNSLFFPKALHNEPQPQSQPQPQLPPSQQQHPLITSPPTVILTESLFNSNTSLTPPSPLTTLAQAMFSSLTHPSPVCPVSLIASSRSASQLPTLTPRILPSTALLLVSPAHFDTATLITIACRLANHRTLETNSSEPLNPRNILSHGLKSVSARRVTAGITAIATNGQKAALKSSLFDDSGHLQDQELLASRQVAPTTSGSTKAARRGPPSASTSANPPASGFFSKLAVASSQSASSTAAARLLFDDFEEDSHNVLCDEGLVKPNPSEDLSIEVIDPIVIDNDAQNSSSLPRRSNRARYTAPKQDIFSSSSASEFAQSSDSSSSDDEIMSVRSKASPKKRTQRITAPKSPSKKLPAPTSRALPSSHTETPTTTVTKPTPAPPSRMTLAYQTLQKHIETSSRPSQTLGSVLHYENVDWMFEEADQIAQLSTSWSQLSSSNDASQQPPTTLGFLGQAQTSASTTNSTTNIGGSAALEKAFEAILTESKIPVIFTANSIPQMFRKSASDVSHYLSEQHTSSSSDLASDASNLPSLFGSAASPLQPLDDISPLYFIQNTSRHVHIIHTAPDQQKHIVLAVFFCLVDLIWTHSQTLFGSSHLLHQLSVQRALLASLLDTVIRLCGAANGDVPSLVSNMSLYRGDIVQLYCSIIEQRSQSPSSSKQSKTLLDLDTKHTPTAFLFPTSYSTHALSGPQHHLLASPSSSTNSNTLHSLPHTVSRYLSKHHQSVFPSPKTTLSSSVPTHPRLLLANAISSSLSAVSLGHWTSFGSLNSSFIGGLCRNTTFPCLTASLSSYTNSEAIFHPDASSSYEPLFSNALTFPKSSCPVHDWVLSPPSPLDLYHAARQQQQDDDSDDENSAAHFHPVYSTGRSRKRPASVSAGVDVESLARKVGVCPYSFHIDQQWLQTSQLSCEWFVPENQHLSLAQFDSLISPSPTSTSPAAPTSHLAPHLFNYSNLLIPVTSALLITPPLIDPAVFTAQLFSDDDFTPLQSLNSSFSRWFLAANCSSTIARSPLVSMAPSAAKSTPSSSSLSSTQQPFELITTSSQQPPVVCGGNLTQFPSTVSPIQPPIACASLPHITTHHSSLQPTYQIHLNLASRATIALAHPSNLFSSILSSPTKPSSLSHTQHILSTLRELLSTTQHSYWLLHYTLLTHFVAVVESLSQQPQTMVEVISPVKSTAHSRELARQTRLFMHAFTLPSSPLLPTPFQQQQQQPDLNVSNDTLTSSVELQNHVAIPTKPASSSILRFATQPIATPAPSQSSHRAPPNHNLPTAVFLASPALHAANRLLQTPHFGLTSLTSAWTVYPSALSSNMTAIPSDTIIIGHRIVIHDAETLQKRFVSMSSLAALSQFHQSINNQTSLSQSPHLLAIFESLLPILLSACDTSIAPFTPQLEVKGAIGQSNFPIANIDTALAMLQILSQMDPESSPHAVDSLFSAIPVDILRDVLQHAMTRPQFIHQRSSQASAATAIDPAPTPPQVQPPNAVDQLPQKPRAYVDDDDDDGDDNMETIHTVANLEPMTDSHDASDEYDILDSLKLPPEQNALQSVSSTKILAALKPHTWYEQTLVRYLRSHTTTQRVDQRQLSAGLLLAQPLLFSPATVLTILDHLFRTTMQDVQHEQQSSPDCNSAMSWLSSFFDMPDLSPIFNVIPLSESSQKQQDELISSTPSLCSRGNPISSSQTSFTSSTSSVSSLPAFQTLLSLLTTVFDKTLSAVWCPTCGPQCQCWKLTSGIYSFSCEYLCVSASKLQSMSESAPLSVLLPSPGTSQWLDGCVDMAYSDLSDHQSGYEFSWRTEADLKSRSTSLDNYASTLQNLARSWLQIAHKHSISLPPSSASRLRGILEACNEPVLPPEKLITNRVVSQPHLSSDSDSDSELDRPAFSSTQPVHSNSSSTNSSRHHTQVTFNDQIDCIGDPSHISHHTMDDNQPNHPSQSMMSADSSLFSVNISSSSSSSDVVIIDPTTNSNSSALLSPRPLFPIPFLPALPNALVIARQPSITKCSPFSAFKSCSHFTSPPLASPHAAKQAPIVLAACLAETQSLADHILSTSSALAARTTTSSSSAAALSMSHASIIEPMSRRSMTSSLGCDLQLGSTHNISYESLGVVNDISSLTSPQKTSFPNFPMIQHFAQHLKVALQAHKAATSKSAQSSKSVKGNKKSAPAKQSIRSNSTDLSDPDSDTTSSKRLPVKRGKLSSTETANKRSRPDTLAPDQLVMLSQGNTTHQETNMNSSQLLVANIKQNKSLTELFRATRSRDIEAVHDTWTVYDCLFPFAKQHSRKLHLYGIYLYYLQLCTSVMSPCVALPSLPSQHIRAPVNDLEAVPAGIYAELSQNQREASAEWYSSDVPLLCVSSSVLHRNDDDDNENDDVTTQFHRSNIVIPQACTGDSLQATMWKLCRNFFAFPKSYGFLVSNGDHPDQRAGEGNKTFSKRISTVDWFDSTRVESGVILSDAADIAGALITTSTLLYTSFIASTAAQWDQIKPGSMNAAVHTRLEHYAQLFNNNRLSAQSVSLLSSLHGFFFLYLETKSHPSQFTSSMRCEIFPYLALIAKSVQKHQHTFFVELAKQPPESLDYLDNFNPASRAVANQLQDQFTSQYGETSAVSDSKTTARHRRRMMSANSLSSPQSVFYAHPLVPSADAMGYVPYHLLATLSLHIDQ